MHTYLPAFTGRVNIHLASQNAPTAMHSGSDSDSFDEGDLTVRGRKAKGKAALRANEKGKQKAKDVRTQCHLWHTDPFD